MHFCDDAPPLFSSGGCPRYQPAFDLGQLHSRVAKGKPRSQVNWFMSLIGFFSTDTGLRFTGERSMHWRELTGLL